MKNILTISIIFIFNLLNAQITFNNDGVNLSSATGNAPDLSKTVAAGTDRLLVVL